MSNAGDDMKALLGLVAKGETLTVEQSRAAFDILMSGDATPAQAGAFLLGLRVRGETVPEITGGAMAMRSRAVAMDAPPGAIDTCGTGGDSSGTYNISTGTAFIVAACGVPVAKHGNRAMSSKSGSADVLTALGVNIDADLAHVRESLWEVGIGFMMAPRHHGAMRHVAGVRVELGTRTIFNLLGPLSNPAGAKRQLLGVFAREWTEPLAEVLGRLGSERVWVVHGSDGLDEITTTGPTLVAEYRNGEVRQFEVRPEDVGLAPIDPAALKGGDAAHNADVLRATLEGRHGPLRDIMLLNAAAALVVADRAEDLGTGMAMAADAVDSGHAVDTLERMIAISRKSEAQTA
ncbi:MAG: anthranilate phosphoribosyltransferase [Rhodospirillaceae bacterium]|nr:anthranilate phosphoribosyltransferase [Rhodospirillaceae bacterium]